MIKKWEAPGLKTNIVNVNSLSGFSTELLSGNTILRYEASNGLLVYQFPTDRFINKKTADKNVADLNGMNLPKKSGRESNTPSPKKKKIRTTKAKKLKPRKCHFEIQGLKWRHPYH